MSESLLAENSLAIDIESCTIGSIVISIFGFNGHHKRLAVFNTDVFSSLGITWKIECGASVPRIIVDVFTKSCGIFWDSDNFDLKLISY